MSVSRLIGGSFTGFLCVRRAGLFVSVLMSAEVDAVTFWRAVFSSRIRTSSVISKNGANRSVHL